MQEHGLKAIDTREMSRDEWLKARMQGIGSSDIGAILGFSKYKTAFEVWQEKTAECVIETIQTPAMKRGIIFEDTVAEMYKAETGRMIWRDNKVRIHEALPFMLANLDRIIPDLHDGRGTGILEIKTVSSYAYKAWAEEIPNYYYAQLQHQLFVTGWTWGEMAVCVVDTGELNILPFERNEIFIEEMVDVAKLFWACVQSKNPPERVASDFSKSASVLGAKEATIDILAKCGTINSLKSHMKELKSETDTIIEEVQSFIGDCEKLTSSGEIIATWKRSKDGVTLDAKKLAAEKPEIYERYSITKPGSRRFLMAKED